MDRREALLGFAATATLVGCGRSEPPKVDPDPVRTSAPTATPGDHHEHHDRGDDGFAKVAHGCLRAGDACAAHCRVLLSGGDASMAECAAAVDDMLAVVEAIRKLKANGSKHVAAQAKVTADACRTCEAACKVHADEHPTCKACMEACAATAAACDKLV